MNGNFYWIICIKKKPLAMKLGHVQTGSSRGRKHKYFFGVEKSRQCENAIQSLKDRNGVTKYEDNEILAIAHVTSTVIYIQNTECRNKRYRKLYILL